MPYHKVKVKSRNVIFSKYYNRELANLGFRSRFVSSHKILKSCVLSCNLFYLTAIQIASLQTVHIFFIGFYYKRQFVCTLNFHSCLIEGVYAVKTFYDQTQGLQCKGPLLNQQTKGLFVFLASNTQTCIHVHIYSCMSESWTHLNNLGMRMLYCGRKDRNVILNTI